MKLLEWMNRIWMVKFGKITMGQAKMGGKIYEE